MTDAKNVCCPSLAIYDCEDTTNHCHFGCDQSTAIISNTTVKSTCMENWNACIHNFVEGALKE